MSVFGPIVNQPAIQQAVVETIDLWIVTYLAEIERQNDLEPRAIQLPKSYITSDDGELNKWPEDQLPAILVMCPGNANDPVERADGYTANFAVNVAAIVSQRDKESTTTMAGYYGAALMALIVQNPSLGGIANGVRWRGGRTDDLAPDDARSIAAAVHVFEVEVENVVQLADFGLNEPPEDPYEAFEFETPDSITVDVEQEAP